MNSREGKEEGMRRKTKGEKAGRENSGQRKRQVENVKG